MLAYDRAILDATRRLDATAPNTKESRDIEWEIWNLELDKRDHYE